MLKDQVQAEAEKAAQAIRVAMLEFNRATGFEMKVNAGWSTRGLVQEGGSIVVSRKLHVEAVAPNVVAAA